jgi:hypothetical protein
MSGGILQLDGTRVFHGSQLVAGSLEEGLSLGMAARGAYFGCDTRSWVKPAVWLLSLLLCIWIRRTTGSSDVLRLPAPRQNRPRRASSGGGTDRQVARGNTRRQGRCPDHQSGDVMIDQCPVTAPWLESLSCADAEALGSLAAVRAPGAASNSNTYCFQYQFYVYAIPCEHVSVLVQPSELQDCRQTYLWARLQSLLLPQKPANDTLEASTCTSVAPLPRNWRAAVAARIPRRAWDTIVLAHWPRSRQISIHRHSVQVLVC